MIEEREVTPSVAHRHLQYEGRNHGTQWWSDRMKSKELDPTLITVKDFDNSNFVPWSLFIRVNGKKKKAVVPPKFYEQIQKLEVLSSKLGRFSTYKISIDMQHNVFFYKNSCLLVDCLTSINDKLFLERYQKILNTLGVE